MTSTNRVWLTPEAHERLRAELASLLAPSTPEDPPHSGADGAVDNGQARAARVREIQQILASAVVGQDPPNDGVAEPGMVLTIRYDDTADEETFLLGLRAAEHSTADGDRDDLIEVYSPTSPLGMALIGARPGDRRSYQVPNGSTVHVTLLHAVPYGQHRLQRAATTHTG
ncbi:GreA/GreB family elongation factor [Goodfellowiella coeruleoviolacea]|uniref:GreA/GreB family elongation factor n=1 Tax=Goodfellowiella coeruleoviolacea TaxID=334858 RepID=A0AAE3G886_9PSEU|nr:GreA/GreB family elongation factor [Goodfellowiella coeruleoviolacea]MCP2163472.1 GreA/GreB family elongation factor [Goodfellowiella coeruleoviolacea]